MLTVDNINLHYGAAQALRGVSIIAQIAMLSGAPFAFMIASMWRMASALSTFGSRIAFA